jgi:hypothetical protein
MQAAVAERLGQGAISETPGGRLGYGPKGRTADWAFRHVDLVWPWVQFSEVSTGFDLPQPLIRRCVSDNLGRNYKAGVRRNGRRMFLSRLPEIAICCGGPRTDASSAGSQRLKARTRPTLPGEDEVRRRSDHLILTLRRCACRTRLVTWTWRAEHWAAEAFTVLQPRTYFNRRQPGDGLEHRGIARRTAPSGRQTVALLVMGAS